METNQPNNAEGYWRNITDQLTFYSQWNGGEKKVETRSQAWQWIPRPKTQDAGGGNGNQPTQ